MAVSVLQLPLGSMGANAYLVWQEGNKEAFIVDPGDEFARLNRILKEKQFTLAAILLTHGHFDHIGAARELREHTGAKIYAMKEEQKTLEDAEWNLSAFHSTGYGLEADVFLRDKEILTPAGISVQVLFTPGHTAGGCCYYLKEEEILFSGDTLFHTSIGRSDFPGGSEAVLIRSIKEKLLSLPERTKVYPGHMEATDIHTEKVFNPYLG